MSEAEDRATPAFSPVGERGPTGDSGSPGATGLTGESGDTGETGERGKAGHDGASGPPGLDGPIGPVGPVVVVGKPPLAQILSAAAVVLFVLSMVLSQVFAWTEVSALRDRVNQFADGVIADEAIEDCRALYRNDVFVSMGSSVAALNMLVVSALAREPVITDEDRALVAEENQLLGEQLGDENRPLLNAIQKMNAYDVMNPPPKDCPHPDSDRG